MISKYTLKQGPSREQLFDCVRLGPTIPELRVIDFWGEHKTATFTSGGSLPIEIEGVHRASSDGREWFFWGRRKQITSGDKWVPMWESKYIDFAFGRWNTYHRTGFVQFAEVSFFTHPVQDEEEPVVQGLENYSNCTLLELPLGRYKTMFVDKLGSGKKAELELQPYDGKLRLRFVCGNPVICAGQLIEYSRWMQVNPDPEKSVEESLHEMIRFVK